MINRLQRRIVAAVSHYQRCYQQRALEEITVFRRQRTLKKAVAAAALAVRPDGKRYDHQRRIPLCALIECRDRLFRALKKLARVRNFEDLHVLVNSLIRPIRGIGELTVYDTALRIGAQLKLEPRHIYLHSGTRMGARRLGLDTTSGRLSVDQVPGPMRRLKPREIEDVLCIYKDHFRHHSAVSLRGANCR